jgi:protein SCO1/2
MFLRGLKRTLAAFLAVLSCAPAATAPAPAAARKTLPPDSIGVSEKLGDSLPGDITCVDERGEEIRLDALLGKPVILCLVYYSCAHICPQVLVGLGRLVPQLDLRAGVDYRLITISFDAADTPAAAASAKQNYLHPLGPDFPGAAWLFATASEENITRLTGALGFRFAKRPHGFIHPSILVILSPGGRIARYIHVTKYNYGEAYPVAFSPVEIKQALLEAWSGRLSPTPPAPLLFCFPMEPSRQSRYFRLMAMSGWITLAGLGALFTTLSIKRRRRKEG